MTPTQRSNLAKVALGMLNAGIPLSMKEYIINPSVGLPLNADDGIKIPRNIYDRLTTESCCFAGFGPLFLGGLPKTNANAEWEKFILRKFGIDFTKREHNDQWHFLFNTTWPASKKQAATRVLVYLMNGVPRDYTEESIFLKRWTIDQIKDELSGFII